jgi:hypothetical protein
MAKQTFTTGQVLTAAQMTSLQQTAMLGGDASVKTASYVLVAADAGTTVAMNASGSTTITVNTGLFSAGDTVFIQNRGAGNCTVTAGTATVSTAGSLILPQYDAGILYFTSASAAIFYDYIQTGATSPLTTKGDIWGYSTSDARIPIGTNGDVLTADSTQTLGLKWATPATSALTLISSTTFSSSSAHSVNDVFSATYDNYLILINVDSASTGASLNMRLRVSGSDNSNSNYYWVYYGISATSTTLDPGNSNGTATQWNIGYSDDTNGSMETINIRNPYLSLVTSFNNSYTGIEDNNVYPYHGGGRTTVTTSYTGFTIFPTSGTISGKVRVYGYANS